MEEYKINWNHQEIESDGNEHVDGNEHGVGLGDEVVNEMGIETVNEDAMNEYGMNEDAMNEDVVNEMVNEHGMTYQQLLYKEIQSMIKKVDDNIARGEAYVREIIVNQLYDKVVFLKNDHLKGKKGDWYLFEKGITCSRWTKCNFEQSKLIKFMDDHVKFKFTES